MGRAEHPIDRAERRIREGEARIARLLPIVERLEGAGHGRAAAEARRVLVNFETSLELARHHLRLRRAAPRRPANSH